MSLLQELSPAHAVLNFRLADPPATTPPLLFIVVDTEEEFDWSAPFSRASTSVRAIARLVDLQRLVNRFGAKPTYVIDYPVATRPEAFTLIRELVESGRCDVGAHLHPWVTPPFAEELNGRNSFACNLGVDLEEAKLCRLTDAIEEHVGVRPAVYKAGRYGFGATTVSILERLHYRIDTSINPLMEYRTDGGPSFEAFESRPFFFGKLHQLLEIPCTHGYTGLARRHGRVLHRASEARPCRAIRATGILRRMGLLDKVMLSPETSTLGEMRALTSTLLEEGIRTFTLTLHSPSLEPGHTPYVRSTEELRRFLDRIEAFCEYFCGTLGGAPGVLEEFRGSLLSGGVAA